MKLNRLTWTLVPVACAAVGFWSWSGSSKAAASDESIGAAVLLGTAAGETPQYVGSKSCKKCHSKVHKSWAKTKMGQALETLKPGNATEAKEKHGLDPNKDYSQDDKCLKCHTTGHGEPGGYEIPAADDKKAVKKAKSLAGVGCECCHGPGSEYVKIFKEIQKSKRTYKPEELYAVGMRKVEEAVCTSCHNADSPTVEANKPFDFAAGKDKDTHHHEPLKQREG
jgi:formate-dependent nitrite reductase cytochrome c552 subunit